MSSPTEGGRVRYDEYTNLASDVPITGEGWSGASHAWVDGLIPDDARVLARYDDPFLARFAAIATRQHGLGRVTTVGTVPDRTLGRHLGRWLAESSLPGDPWRDVRRSSVTFHGAHDATCRRIRVVHNWSWTPSAFPLPVQVDDLLDSTRLGVGEMLELGAWDVRVLREATSR